MVLADISSNGATPQEKTKQILAIAPILKGQSASQQPAASQSQHQEQSFQPEQPQRQHTSHSDLIDFGQASVPASAIPDRGSSLHHTAQAAAPPGLQEPLTPGAPIRRVDTATKELDEFVDAKP